MTKTPDISVGCRLTSKGLKVLVERSVQTREFPEFDCFDPSQNGGVLSSMCDYVASNVYNGTCQPVCTQGL